MVQHARDLNGVAINGTAEPPSPYVKTYLMPDPHKLTKRKTRIIRRNIHPTFMEMLVYRLPLEQIQQRLLQVIGPFCLATEGHSALYSIIPSRRVCSPANEISLCFGLAR